MLKIRQYPKYRDGEQKINYLNRKTYGTETQTENGVKVDLKLANVIRFWESKGYRNLKMPSGGYELVKIRNNSIICKAYPDELMQEVKHQLLFVDDKAHVWEKFVEKEYISRRSMSAFQTIREIRLNICEPDTAYFYFNNGVLKLKEENIELIAYEDYDGYVFEEQIIPHNLRLTDDIEQN